MVTFPCLLIEKRVKLIIGYLKTSTPPFQLKNTVKSNQLDNEVHIWSAVLDQPKTVIDGYYSILSDYEREMVNKYKSEELKNRQIISKGVLRVLIAKYTNFSPNEINLYYNEFGKPFVSGDSDGNNLFFNLSHSDNIAVFIFSKNWNVGIDVERVKELADMESVVNLCFSESEKKWFGKIQSAKKKEIFYKIWTSKEAYIKAIGKGLSFSPNRISLVQKTDNELFINEINGDKDYSRWKLITFKPHPDFISSVVIENDSLTIKHLSLEPQFIFNQDFQFSEK